MWFLGVGITANGGPHSPQDTRARQRPWRVVVGCALLERRLELYFGRKEAYIWKKIMVMYVEPVS